MKKLLAVILSACLLAGIAVLPAAAEGAFENPGFESVAASGEKLIADGWNFTAAAEAVTGDSAAPSGNYVKLSGPDQTVSPKTFLYGLEPGATYAVSFYLNTSDGGALFELVQYKDDGGTNIRLDSSSQFVSPGATGGQWIKFSKSIIIDADADCITINLRTTPSAITPDFAGTVCYDEISVKAMGDEKVTNGGAEDVSISGEVITPAGWAMKNNTTSSEFYAATAAANEGYYGMVITNSNAARATAVKAVGGSSITHVKDTTATIADTKLSYKYVISAWINIPADLGGEGLRIAVYRDGGNATTTYPAVVLGGGSAGAQANGTCVTGGFKTATGGWVHVYKEFTTPSDTDYPASCVAIELAGTGTAYVDNVSIIPTSGRLLNGDFEDTLTATTPCGAWVFSSATEAKIENTGGYSGNKCISITAFTANKWPNAIGTISNLPAAAAVYKVSFMYKASNGTSLPMFHSDNLSQVNAVETDFIAGTDWQKCYVYLKKPEGQRYLRLRVIGDNSCVRYYDDIRVEIDKTSLTFIDSIRNTTGTMKTGDNTAWFRYVNNSPAENLPVLIICKYETAGEVKKLAGVQLITAPTQTATQTVSDTDTRYIYTYKATAVKEAGDGVTGIEAYAWNDISGVTPITVKAAVK